VAAMVIKLVLVVIFREEIILFFGKLPVAELELQSVQVDLTTTVAGGITGMILILVLGWVLLLACMYVRSFLIPNGVRTTLSHLYRCPQRAEDRTDHQHEHACHPYESVWLHG